MMKTTTQWGKWTRRVALVAIGACCLAALTGCFDDDDDALPAGFAQWKIDWTNDTSGVNPVTILLPVDDLNALDGQMEQLHFDPYTLEISVSGNQVVVDIWDWQAGVFWFHAQGTITSATTATGAYNGEDSNGGIIGGSWTVTKL